MSSRNLNVAQNLCQASRQRSLVTALGDLVIIDHNRATRDQTFEGLCKLVLALCVAQSPLV